MQQDIFENDGKSASKSLMIARHHKQILSKQQETFNRLVKRIEKLRLELLRLGKTLDEKLEFYAREVYPLENEIAALQKETVKLLFKFFKNKTLLSAKQHKSLGGVISEFLDFIFQFEKDEPEDELKIIFKAVQGISYEKAVANDFEFMKNDLESMFDEFGFDVNLDSFTKEMTEEEMAQKQAELADDMKKQAEERDRKQAGRKKSKKQLEKEKKEEQMEEARAKNISSIFKQLAKIFHPDLEQDAELKLEKEELMKQLTNAYEKKDLHTLLRLELTWIQKEENNLNKLTDDKLSIYNEVLKEQIFELEEEMHQLLLHPRYSSLHDLAIFPEEIRTLNLKEDKKAIENNKRMLASGIVKLQSNEKLALSELKRLIHEYDIDNEDDEEFLRFMR